MADRMVIDRAQRDTLVEKLRSDEKFRGLMKADWRAAFNQAGINPKDIEGKFVEYSEAVPLESGPVQAGIIITITAPASKSDEINFKDSVLFTP